MGLMAIDAQAHFIAHDLIPSLIERGFQPERIGVLYRAAWLGDKVADELKARNIAIIRADSNALIKRNSRFARFIEACSQWVTGDGKKPHLHLICYWVRRSFLFMAAAQAVLKNNY